MWSFKAGAPTSLPGSQTEGVANVASTSAGCSLVDFALVDGFVHWLVDVALHHRIRARNGRVGMVPSQNLARIVASRFDTPRTEVRLVGVRLGESSDALLRGFIDHQSGS